MLQASHTDIFHSICGALPFPCSGVPVDCGVVQNPGTVRRRRRRHTGFRHFSPQRFQALLSMSTERTGHHGPKTFAGESFDDATARLPWFIPEITTVPPAGRALLEEYAKIPTEEVLPHVQRLRDRAFALWPYPCIGQVRFLDYTIPRNPYYIAVLARLRAGSTFLDAGCCLGQEIRFLIHCEGISAQQLYGFDLEPAFVEMGLALFRDGSGRLEAKMLSGDLLAEKRSDNGDGGEEDGLAVLEGKMDVVHVASVLHSWGWDDMLKAAKRLVQLSRPQAGNLIVGNQMGSLNAGEYPMPTGKGVNYRHNVESFDRFWAQVGRETGSEWKVESGMVETDAVRDNRNTSFAKGDPGMRMIWFMVERV